jgi:hypothetical protein
MVRFDQPFHILGTDTHFYYDERRPRMASLLRGCVHDSRRACCANGQAAARRVGQIRVPHKPLLLLWLFGQFVAIGSSTTSYQQAEGPVSQMINDSGPPHGPPSCGATTVRHAVRSPGTRVMRSEGCGGKRNRPGCARASRSAADPAATPVDVQELCWRITLESAYAMGPSSSMQSLSPRIRSELTPCVLAEDQNRSQRVPGVAYRDRLPGIGYLDAVAAPTAAEAALPPPSARRVDCDAHQLHVTPSHRFGMSHKRSWIRLVRPSPER